MRFGVAPDAASTASSAVAGRCQIAFFRWPYDTVVSWLSRALFSCRRRSFRRPNQQEKSPERIGAFSVPRTGFTETWVSIIYRRSVSKLCQEQRAFGSVLFPFGLYRFLPVGTNISDPNEIHKRLSHIKSVFKFHCVPWFQIL